MTNLTEIPGGILAPAGFAAASVASGVKRSGQLDLTLLISTNGSSPAAGVFTQSSTAAPPVEVSREALESGMVAAAVVNSGNANACTGAAGLADAKAMASAAAEKLGCQSADVVVSSTGVIGVPLPMETVITGISKAAEVLDTGCDPVAAASDSATAIMTTDTFVKQVAVSVTVGGRVFAVGGMAKGSGMIHPNMATMLAFVTTDAPLTPAACDAVLRSSVDRSFNRITVDGDTSTNDMVLLMASGAAAGEVIDTDDDGFSEIAEAVLHVCTRLAQMIVRDGEGATRFIEITVRGAATEADAHAAAMSIANSPLFKTAIFGADANWGRVAMAVGKSSAKVDASKLEIVFAGIAVCRDGMAVPFDEEAAASALAESDIEVVVDLHIGTASATVWTCDLSYEYVRINGEYRT